jgi:hypothetical protein
VHCTQHSEVIIIIIICKTQCIIINASSIITSSWPPLHDSPHLLCDFSPQVQVNGKDVMSMSAEDVVRILDSSPVSQVSGSTRFCYFLVLRDAAIILSGLDRLLEIHRQLRR